MLPRVVKFDAHTSPLASAHNLRTNLTPLRENFATFVRILCADALVGGAICEDNFDAGVMTVVCTVEVRRRQMGRRGLGRWRTIALLKSDSEMLARRVLRVSFLSSDTGSGVSFTKVEVVDSTDIIELRRLVHLMNFRSGIGDAAESTLPQLMRGSERKGDVS